MSLLVEPLEVARRAGARPPAATGCRDARRGTGGRARSGRRARRWAATRSGSGRRRTAARAADRRVASSFLSDWASVRASARRGVSGNSRRKASMAASGVAGSSMAASERASACDALPALVVPDLLLGGFDLADRGRQLRRLVLELSEPGGQVGRRGAVGDLDVGRLDLPLGLLLPGLRAPAPARRARSDGCHSSSSAQRRATAGAARSPARARRTARGGSARSVVAGQAHRPRAGRGRQPHQPPPAPSPRQSS